VPGHGVVVEGVKGGKYTHMQPEIYKNCAKNGQFPVLIDLKITENAQKDLIRRINELKILLLDRAFWSYNCSKFRESYMPPAIRIRYIDLDLAE
jgi:hypothetical protein